MLGNNKTIASEGKKARHPELARDLPNVDPLHGDPSQARDDVPSREIKCA